MILLVADLSHTDKPGVLLEADEFEMWPRRIVLHNVRRDTINPSICPDKARRIVDEFHATLDSNADHDDLNFPNDIYLSRDWRVRIAKDQTLPVFP